MKTFKDMLIQKLEHYLKIEKILNRIKTPDVKGHISIRNKGNPQYYHCIRNPVTNELERNYVDASNLQLAKQVASNQYYLKLRRIVNKRLKQILSILRDYEENEVDLVYEKYSIEKRRLFTPIQPTYAIKLESWKTEKYTGLGFSITQNKIITKKGEMVRSKSEKILADTFFDFGIEYKYECPLQLKNNVTIYPDFTFLHPLNHDEIYWEHFGMMDDPTYATKAIKKIGLYENNGIFRTERLIFFF